MPEAVSLQDSSEAAGHTIGVGRRPWPRECSPTDVPSTSASRPARRHPCPITHEPATGPVRNRRPPHSTSPVLHPAVGRRTIDSALIWADHPAHRAARVASDVIERAAQAGEQARLERPSGGSWASKRAEESGSARRHRWNDFRHSLRRQTNGVWSVLSPLGSGRPRRESVHIADPSLGLVPGDGPTL